MRKWVFIGVHCGLLALTSLLWVWIGRQYQGILSSGLIVLSYTLTSFVSISFFAWRGKALTLRALLLWMSLCTLCAYLLMTGFLATFLPRYTYARACATLLERQGGVIVHSPFQRIGLVWVKQRGLAEPEGYCITLLQDGARETFLFDPVTGSSHPFLVDDV